MTFRDMIHVIKAAAAAELTRDAEVLVDIGRGEYLPIKNIYAHRRAQPHQLIIETASVKKPKKIKHLPNCATMFPIWDKEEIAS